jgi:hypothetical protein
MQDFSRCGFIVASDVINFCLLAAATVLAYLGMVNSRWLVEPKFVTIAALLSLAWIFIAAIVAAVSVNTFCERLRTSAGSCTVTNLTNITEG